MEDNAAAVERARQGDADAFRWLVETHSRTVFRLAYRMTGNEPDAEDVVQETFLRAYRQLTKFQSRSSFGTWLHQIAVRCALDLLRGRRRHDQRREIDQEREMYALANQPGNTPAQERLVFSREVSDQICHALDLLGPAERAAFVLRHFEGLSIEETGSLLGTSANATKHSIYRAVRKMRQALEPAAKAAS